MNLPGALRRVDQALIVGGLAAASGLAWFYMVQMSGAPQTEGHCGALAPIPDAAWSRGDWVMAFTMWTVMMAAMMLPTAVPMTLTFADMNRERGGTQPIVPAGAFVAGYLCVWTAYSALATLGQWALHSASLLSPVNLTTGPALGGALLLAAGAFQWTPWKDTCMVRCRSPLGFFLAHWRPGRAGAFAMGLRYGAFCVGCCWALMVLSFAVGIMNLGWMALLTLFMLAEKVAPAGRQISRAGGLGLAVWGTALLWRAFV